MSDLLTSQFFLFYHCLDATGPNELMQNAHAGGVGGGVGIGVGFGVGGGVGKGVGRGVGRGVGNGVGKAAQ